MLPATGGRDCTGKGKQSSAQTQRLQNGAELKIVELLLINEEIMPCCNDNTIPIHYFAQEC